MRLTVATVGGQAPPGGRPYSAGGWMSAAGTMASMIGRLHHLILDCPDPLVLIDRFGAGAGPWCDALPGLVEACCQRSIRTWMPTGSGSGARPPP